MNINAYYNYLYTKFKLYKSRRKNSGVCLKIKDIDLFFKDLNESGIPYVVLRKPDQIYCDEHKKNNTNDIDILLDTTNLNLKKFTRIFSSNKGLKPVEVYSNNGRHGMSYKKLPYFPPSLANKILNNRIKYKSVFIPNPNHHTYSYLFHLLYHKQEDSGFKIHTVNNTDNNLKKTYDEYFKKFDLDKNFNIAQCNNLLEIHKFLKQKHWSLNYDLLTRISKNSNCLSKVLNYEEKFLQAESISLKFDIIIFLFREASTNKLHFDQESLHLIQKGFQIICTSDLDDNTIQKLMLKTRGGNWYCPKGKIIIPPIRIIVCSPKKHICHNYEDVIISTKLDLRKFCINNKFLHSSVHSTDNTLESIQYLNVIDSSIINSKIKNFNYKQ